MLVLMLFPPLSVVLYCTVIYELAASDEDYYYCSSVEFIVCMYSSTWLTHINEHLSNSVTEDVSRHIKLSDSYFIQREQPFQMSLQYVLYAVDN